MIILFTLVSDFRELSISIFHIHVLKWVRKNTRKACILNSYLKTASFYRETRSWFDSLNFEVDFVGLPVFRNAYRYLICTVRLQRRN